MMGMGKRWVEGMAWIIMALFAVLVTVVIFASGCATISEGLTHHLVNSIADRLNVPQQGVTLDEMVKGLGASTFTLMAAYAGLKLKGRGK